jgi:hypothetical protein
MAITATTGIASNNKFSAFDDVPVTVTTNGSTVILIKMEVKSGSTVLATEYSNVFVVGAARLAYFNLRGTFSSLMNSHNNIVEVGEEYGSFELADNMTEHHKSFSVVFYEYITEPINSVTLTGIILYKAVNYNPITIDADNDFLAFEPVDCERTAFINEYIYPTVFSLGADRALRVTDVREIGAEHVNGFLQFKVQIESDGNVVDCYMPSIDELSLMDTVLNANSIGDFSGDYISSSQHDVDNAKGRQFGTGVGTYEKETPYLVRPVRTFISSTPIAPQSWGEYGWVFYRDGTTHIEALPVEYEESKIWGSLGVNISTATAVGTGKSNTDNIAAVETGVAADYCLSVEFDNTIELYTDDGDVRSNKVRVFVDSNTYPRSKTLHFLNKYGGWDFYNIIDFEETTRTERAQYTKYRDNFGRKEIHQYIGSSVKELKCYGRAGRADKLAYIEGLVTSPVVYDEAGVRVRVLDDKILTDAEGIIEPEFTIQYLEENTINY